jgi:hypothetical protein
MAELTVAGLLLTLFLSGPVVWADKEAIKNRPANKVQILFI